MTVIDTGHLGEDDLDEDSAAEHIHGICLKTGPPRRVGVELEWLVRDARDPYLPVPAGRIAAAVSAFDAVRGRAEQGNNGHQGKRGRGRREGPRLPTSSRPGVLPSGAPLTTEPGGQLEVSSLPADSLAELVQATSSDIAALRGAVAEAGLELAGIGLDPLRPPRRVLDLPRYAAMEAFFDRGGPWGRQMMCGTASVQVYLDAGDDSDGPSGYRWRWRLLHAIGPVLVAAFANSPLRGGRPTGWASSRQEVWAHMDPRRTRPPRLDADPRTAWAGYALDADIMCVRNPDSGDWSAPPGLTLRDWVRAAVVPAADGPGGGRDGSDRNGNDRNGNGRTVPARTDPARAGIARADRRPTGDGAWAGSPRADTDTGAGGAGGGVPHSDGDGDGRLRRPTPRDLEYHLSTLFPPVRPRGHFELRMIDAQPGDGWIVPLAVSAALLSDAQAGEAALAAVAPLWDERPPGWSATATAGTGGARRRRAAGSGGRSAGHDADGDDGPWLRAARRGPADPAISRASRECFAAAREALARMAVPAEVTAAVDAFAAEYVSKDRCPADDLREEAN
jgi:glutamate--cysteine ligase